MSFVWSAAVWVIAVAAVVISKWLYRWSNPKCNGKLPPGSMGLPIIGETCDFFEPHGLYEISPFVKKRMLKYGPLFRTNIFGSNTVVLTEPDIIFEVFRQENKSFVFSYPEAFVKPFGKENVFLKHGNIHKHVKQISLQHLGSEALKKKMIGGIDRVTYEHLRSKANQGSFDAKEAVESVIMAHLTPKIISNLKPETQATLVDNIMALGSEWFQSPLKLTTLISIYKVFIARRYALQVIKDVFTRRKASREMCGDFLDTMVEEGEKEDVIFNEESAINLIFAILVVAKESTSSVTSLAIKFLAENHKALAELKREHAAILQNRNGKGAGVSWEEYRHQMTFTNMVINETLRMANMAPIMYRKAVNDVEIKGYTIPAGWIVAVIPPAVHFNDAIYENPLEFNPWRWEGKELRSGSKTFMVFGGGVRQCVGAEFARLQISIFIHHLVTTYDFSLAQESEFIRAPLPYFPKGLPIKISQSL
nr:AT5G48000 [Arabidopsis thaliana]